MRVFITSSHRYPASVGGFAGCRVFDFLAKGLCELGHTVFYRLEGGVALPLPDGIIQVTEPVFDVDIIQVHGNDLSEELSGRNQPWVRTCHVDLTLKGLDRSSARSNWIYVSRTLATAYGSDRFVWNGVDPSEFIYSEEKEDYFLFVSALGRAMSKGLDIAVSLSKQLGFRLIVAGSSPDNALVEKIRAYCETNGVECVGEVWGTRKAKLFAGARALLFPTKWNESFGMVIAEALISGTPVIASNNGACAELVSPDVGFVCATRDDYITAIDQSADISPRACREWALNNFHYLKMASDYVREYEVEIARMRRSAHACHEAPVQASAGR